MTFAVWLTGLPASGKSAVARELGALLAARSVPYSVLESDVMRTQLTPHPAYDEAERDFFYSALAVLGAHVAGQGRAVIFDATANLRRYRDAARARIGRFAEIHVDTPLEVCRARDPKGLYRSARSLPGMQAPYEAPLAAELTLDGGSMAPHDAASAIVRWVADRGWISVR